MNISTLYNINVNLFETLNLDYRSYKHEPILDYETDLKVSKELGWTAAPSKSLFLKRKSGGYCVFVTHKENRFDQKKIRMLLVNECLSATMKRWKRLRAVLPVRYALLF